MLFTEIPPSQLFSSFTGDRTIYSSETFISLNARKAEAIRTFALIDSKGTARLGIILGLRDGIWQSPFSAPFGEIYCNHPQHLETVLEFARGLKGSGLPMRITLPPGLYVPEMSPEFEGAFTTVAYRTIRDFNYHYPLTRHKTFAEGLHPNARTKLNRAMREGLEIHTGAPLERAYRIIAQNRQEQGYPLAMSLGQLADTSEIVAIDSFVVSHEGRDVASAIVYRVAPRIAQVIYWGDLADSRHLRPMNLIPYAVTDFYRRLGYTIVDIGPSSRDGIPDIGLCAFKESIGCELTFKPTFLINQ